MSVLPYGPVSGMVHKWTTSLEVSNMGDVNANVGTKFQLWSQL